MLQKYFYPRSPCGERRSARCSLRETAAISIHALLAESDVEEVSGDTWARDFYPRSPCGERLPHTQHSFLHPANFYPRSPCGERPIQWKCHNTIF